MAVQNINTYAGNAALGQGTAGGEGIIGAYDMKHVNDAMDKLVQYQVLYNRDRWARNNLLVDRDAKDAAEMMKFTIGNWDEPERNIIMGQISQLHELYKTNPKRTRLLSDGSNADAVAEFQNLAYQIEYNIGRANAKKVQTNALNKQIEAATDEEERAKMIKWKAQEDAKPITEDKLLYPSITPFMPLDTPNAQPIDIITYDDKGNIETKRTLTLPDLGQGMANYEFVMSSTKGRKAIEFVSTQADDFNKLIERVKQEEQSKINKYQKTGGPTEQDIFNAIMDTEEGRTKMNLLQRFNTLAKRNNEHVDQTGLAVQDEIKWFDGITQTDYVKMLVGGGAKSVGDKADTTYIGLGVKGEELELKKLEEKNQNARFYSNLRQQADQWKKEFDAGKEPDVDPLIKNSVITSLLSTPESGIVDPTTKRFDIAKTRELENMFLIPIAEVEKLSGTGKEGEDSFKEKFSQLEILSIQAEQVGSDMNDTRIHVTYKHPKTGETKEQVFDRRALGIAANNIFGTAASAAKIAAADAKFKREIGENNPTIEQMNFKNRPVAPTGKPGSDSNPLPLPTYMKNGVETVDSKKVKSGNTYVDKKGRKISF